MTNAPYELPRGTAEELGLSSKDILAFLDNVDKRRIKLHGLVLLRHGKIALQCDWAPFSADDPHPIYSVTKCFVSAAVGLAKSEGRLSIDDRVVSFFPEKAPYADDMFTDKLTVRHLLTMTTGNGTRNIPPEILGDDWIGAYLRIKRTHTPGAVFFYNNMAAHTLCGIIQKVTGETVHDYLRPRLLEPLGITGLEFSRCPMGINQGAGGIRCTVMDIAKLGQLYLQGGKWDGCELLPEDWVRESTARHVDNSATELKLENQDGYGYQFWRGRNDSYMGYGHGGQFMLVVPGLDVVCATVSNSLEFWDGQQMILDCVWDHLLSRLRHRALPPDPPAAEALRRRLDGLAIAIPGMRGVSAPLWPRERLYHFDTNPADMAACLVSLSPDGCRLEIGGVDGVRRTVVNAGYASYKNCDLGWFPGEPAAAAAGWVDDRTLLIEVHLTRRVAMLLFTCRFDGDYMTVHIKLAPDSQNAAFPCFTTGTAAP